MAGGKSKKKRNSKDSIGSNGTGNEKQAKNKKKTTSKRSKSGKFTGDIFNEAAMENAYYLCHNVQDVLKSRGFGWPEAQKKKKKGKR